MSNEDNNNLEYNSSDDPIRLSVEEQDYQDYLAFKRERRKNEGFTHPLGDSVNQKTVESYERLRLAPQDSAYLASRRHKEEMKRSIIRVKGSIKITTVNNQIYRLANKKDNKEWLVYNYTEHFLDLNGNHIQISYDGVGAHQEVYGSQVKNINGQFVEAELEGVKNVYDLEFNKKEIDKVMKRHGTGELIDSIESCKLYRIK